MNHIYSQRYRDFIAAIRKARKAKKITQVELAAALGKEQSFISRVETCETLLGIVEFADIAALLGLDVVQLITDMSSKRTIKRLK